MLFDDIRKDIEKKVESALEKTAVEVEKQMEDAYKSSVSNFYMDYEPMKYIRKWGLYNKAYTPIIDVKKNGFLSGIHVDPSLASGVANHQADSDVFEWAFDMGIHGTPKYAPRTTPPDWYMQEYKAEILDKLPSMIKKNLKL